MGSGDSQATLALLLTAKDLASKDLGKLHDSLDKVDKKSGSTGRNMAKLGGIIAIGVVGAAVGLVAILGKAAAAAAEEQKGVVKLSAALKANDKSFTGNMAAIDAAIDAGEKLAFTDDDLRDSMAFLVTKTKDANEALALQQTAMDLSRLKGIDLTSASEMLTKAMDGSSKILKQLGIDLPATATQQERLAAIQKAAAGQAEAYGNTAAGAQEAMQIAIDDTVEELGTAFLPILKDVALFVRDVVVPAIKSVITSVRNWLTANKPLVDGVKSFVETVLKVFVGVLGALFTALGKIVDWITSNKAIMDGLRSVFKGIAFQVSAFVAGLKWIVDNAGKLSRALDGIYSNVNPNSPAGHYLGIPGSASGGWVGLNGPEVRMVGERGPEYVIPNHQLDYS